MISQETISKILVFANQTQQQVLGLDRRATELAGFVASEEDDPPGSLCVSFEHKFLILSMPGIAADLILNEPPKSNKRQTRTEVRYIFLKTPASNSHTSSH